jgi:hypothetical protein
MFEKMCKEISLVEVLMVKYQAGNKEYSSYLENELQLFDVFYEQVTEEIPEVMAAIKEKEAAEAAMEVSAGGDWIVGLSYPSLADKPDLIFTDTCTGFSFRFFGQTFDRHYSGGLEWECNAMDTDFVFGTGYGDGWLNELRTIGEQIIAGKQGQGRDIDGTVVRFVTAWEYHSWQDSYNKEFDSEWNLLGEVDLSHLEIVANIGGNCLAIK